jgi:hypothetical protein
MQQLDGGVAADAVSEEPAVGGEERTMVLNRERDVHRSPQGHLVRSREIQRNTQHRFSLE